MAVFGFPIQQADASASAVAAAIEMLDAVERYAAEVRSPVPLQLRIGINTGLMIAGDLRSVTVLNATIDMQQPITLRLRGCKEGLEAMEWVTPKEKPVTVSVRWEGKDVIAVLPAIGPWQIGWLRPTVTD